jgi:hypothetical protein
MKQTKEQVEYEAALRRAFVEHRADFIVLSSHRDQFRIESANYGVDQGWINGEWDELDEQNTVWIGRLTDKGRERFGLSAAPALPEGAAK